MSDPHYNWMFDLRIFSISNRRSRGHNYKYECRMENENIEFSQVIQVPK